MNSSESKELDREVELPYKVHQYKLIDKRYISFLAPRQTTAMLFKVWMMLSHRLSKSI